MIGTNMIPLLFSNMFFVVFSLLIFQLFVMERTISLKGKRTVLFLQCAIVMVLCISFPIKLNSDYFFDLRQIPLIIGFLYGGQSVGTGLYFLLIFYRFSIGGDGAIGTFLENTCLLFVLYLIYQRYHQATKQRKYLHILFLSLFSFTISIGFYLYLSGTENVGLFSVIQLELYIIQTVFIYLCIYFIEVMIRNRTIRDKVNQAEKVEIVSHLAASISHEIRNPLTVSRGFLQLLNDVNLSTKNRREYIQLAVKEIDRAIQIITDYLSFAKPSLEKDETLNISNELKSLLEVLTPYANMRSIQFNYSFTPNYTVNGEKQKFKQSMLNIIKNSIEAMPEGGFIHINTFVEAKDYYITIEDNGIGMTKKQIERLGEPYFSTKEKGTGLGMMVVYSTIKAMNGKIKVKSEIGKGTKFTIRFPVENNTEA